LFSTIDASEVLGDGSGQAIRVVLMGLVSHGRFSHSLLKLAERFAKRAQAARNHSRRSWHGAA
jgi:hypothetical protein